MKTLISALLVGTMATTSYQEKVIPKDFKKLVKEIKKEKSVTVDTFLKYTDFKPASGAYTSRRIIKYIHFNDSTLGYVVNETDGSYVKADLTIFRPNNPQVKSMKLTERNPPQSYQPKHSFMAFEWANDTIIKILKVSYTPADTACIEGSGRYKAGYQFPDCTATDSSYLYFALSAAQLIHQISESDLPPLD